MVSFFIFISTIELLINPVFGQKCDNTPETNEAIVNSIYEKIKGNKDLASQVSHINITSTNLAVKIQGWVDNQSNYDKVRQYALDAECARVVNENEFSVGEPTENLMPRGGGCAPGTRQCGDICIPDNDVCNIKG
jgi:hypothetical protein